MCIRDRYHKAAKALHIKSEQIAGLQIRRQSIDARKKPDIFLIYVVDITLNGISEQNCVSRSKNKDVSIVTERPYQFPKPGTKAPVSYTHLGKSGKYLT